MALDLRLQVKLSQQLVMTPQLQQAIKLLQLSRMELADVVTEELVENPLLEEDEERKETAEDSGQTATADESGKDTQVATEQQNQGEAEGVNDIDWQTYLESYSLTSSDARDAYESPEERPAYDSLLTKKSS